MNYKKLFLVPMVIVFVAAAGSVGVGQWYIGGLLKSDYQRQAVLETRMVASAFSYFREFPKDTELHEFAAELSKVSGGRVSIIDIDGTVLTDTDVPNDALKGVENHANRPEILQAYKEGVGVAMRTSATVGKSLTYVAVPYHVDQRKGTVRLAVYNTKLENIMFKQRALFVVTALIGISIVGGIGLVVMRGYVRQISLERENLESARISAQAADKAKSEFLSSINHELRTPLTSSLGSLGLLNSLAKDDFSDQRQELLDIAIKNNEAMLRLVSELLDYEKILSGQMKIETSRYDLSELTSGIVKNNEGYAQKQSVNFVFNVPPKPIFADVQEHRFGQILGNLLSNAAKFSPSGSDVEISINSNDAHVTVSVADRGSGIPDDFKDKIFEQFTQIDSSSTREHGGTGLGLTISKALTEGMGGTLDFDSQVGVGSTFYVSFPDPENPRLSSDGNAT